MIHQSTRSAGYIFRVLALTVWGVVILWLALIPVPPHITGLAGWDKAQHAAAIAVFTILAGLVFQPLARKPVTGWRVAVLTALLFGVLIEVLQALLTSTRTAEVADVAADLVGAVSSYGCYLVWTMLSRRS